MSSCNQLSKIFINSLTVLDCAVWDLKRGPAGRSWNVDVEWTGTTNHEGVVIDFSAAKKMAKSIIDTFFDHRLFISEKLALRNGTDRLTCIPSPETPFADRFFLDTYPDSLAVFEHNILRDVTDGSLHSLEARIAAAVLDGSPSNVTNVRIRLREHPQTTSPVYFNYLHSLKLHEGNCQRFHGHSNIIEVFENGSFSEQKSAFAAQYLNGKYIVACDYPSEPSTDVLARLDSLISSSEMHSDFFSWIDYQGSQGRVFLKVPSAKLLVTDDESSIENISVWIHKNLFGADPSVSVYAYEGLNKGAICP